MSDLRAKIRDALGLDAVEVKNGVKVSSHARYNLEGCLHDLEAGHNDGINHNTLHRIAKQLAEVERLVE